MENKIKIVVYGFTILLLLAVDLTGIFYTIELFQKYGWSYEVTTIIQGVTTHTTEHIQTFIFAWAFLTWIIILLFYSLLQARSKKENMWAG
jgi:hypothetical protein